MKTTVGIDSIEIERIKKIYEKETEKFLDRIFTKKEQQDILRRNLNKYETMAGKYAVKEAVYKAMSKYAKLEWKDIEVLPEISGRPNVTLYLDNIENITKEDVYIDVSITHDKTKAIAIAYVTYTKK